MTPRRPGRSTIAIHGIPHRLPDWAPVVNPVMQITTFINPVGSTAEVLYTRYGNNPTQLELARKYALLEGAEDALFLSSGMGATALAHLAVLRPGDHLLSSEWIYGGTRRLFDEELGRFGIEVTYVNPVQHRLWRKSVRKATRAIFVETPTNPLLRVVDLTPIAQVSREYGLALLVDATFASPINLRPLEHGADVAISSATKYLNGHSDVIAGAVAGSASFIEEVTRLMRLWGQAIDPHAAWLVDRGLRTLAVRIERHNANGMAIASWGRAAARVHGGPLPRPALASRPRYADRARRFEGWWGFSKGELRCGAVPQEARSSRTRPAWPGSRAHFEPRLTSHQALAPRAGPNGHPDGFPRLSCGIEDAERHHRELEQALGGIFPS
jgi:cystathionine beta-lyase/cystathionine gamma-synthase